MAPPVKASLLESLICLKSPKERERTQRKMDSEPYQWAVNLLDAKYAKSLSVVSSNSLPSPPGFKVVEGTARDATVGKKNHADSQAKAQEIGALQVQKAWQIALQPAKAIPMNFFMSYMSGTSLQIIPIMTALMLLSGPIKSIFGIKKTFKPVLGTAETQSKVSFAMLMFVVFQGALMYIGLRKLNSMGLIPNTRSDWLTWEKQVDYNTGIRSFTF